MLPERKNIWESAEEEHLRVRIWQLQPTRMQLFALKSKLQVPLSGKELAESVVTLPPL